MNINERVAILETEREHSEDRISALEKKVSYYDRMALKYGGALIAVLVIGAMVGGHVEKLKEKLLEWVL